jgi:hypothetical protein
MSCMANNLNTIAFNKTLSNHGPMGNLIQESMTPLRSAQPTGVRNDSAVFSQRSTVESCTSTTTTPIRWAGTCHPLTPGSDACFCRFSSAHYLCLLLPACTAQCQPVDLTDETPQLEAGTQTRETPAALGRRLAAEALPKVYGLSARTVRKTIVKRLSAHVRLPRATGSMSWKFKLELAPLQGVREICEAAGLELQFPLHRIGSGQSAKTRRTWVTNGANATSRFASLQTGHPLAWGGAKLVKAPKMAARKVSRVMTLLAPPLTVVHTNGPDESAVVISGHLVTFNETGEMRLPPAHEELWGTTAKATTRVLSKYAKKMLEGMYLEGLPLSQRFKKQLGSEYPSSEEEEEEEVAEGVEEAEAEQEAEQEAEAELDAVAAAIADALGAEEVLDLMEEVME